MSTPFVDLVALAALCQLFVFGYLVGGARTKYGVKAPAVTGHEMFERAYRVQMNTLEWAVMTLPCLWICAAYVNDAVAASLGGVWLVGRIGYAVGYAREPALRAKGFTVGALAFGALGLTAGGGVVWHLLGN